MPEPIAKEKIKVTVNIRTGQVPPAQRQLWKNFFIRLITEVKASER